MATYYLGLWLRNRHNELLPDHQLSEFDQERLLTETQRQFYKRMIAGHSLTDAEESRLLAEARDQFERVVKDYPDVTSVDGTVRLADKARADSVWIANIPGLKIGKVAPGMAGEDLDGKSLKLASYRGKVVVLCFWATWCVPCMEMVPHKRDLVDRMAEKPFALIGINADEASHREKARTAVLKERMNWPSFWDGGFNGPIQIRYNVDRYPKVYVLDPGGVIRYVDVQGEELDRAVDALLREFEASPKRDAVR